MNSVLREIDIMKGVDSPQIVKYFANYYWKKEIWCVRRVSSVIVCLCLCTVVVRLCGAVSLCLGASAGCAHAEFREIRVWSCFCLALAESALSAVVRRVARAAFLFLLLLWRSL